MEEESKKIYSSREEAFLKSDCKLTHRLGIPEELLGEDSEHNGFEYFCNHGKQCEFQEIYDKRRYCVIDDFFID